jgi:hypothetical protein
LSILIDLAFTQDIKGGLWECECGWRGYPQVLITKRFEGAAVRAERRCRACERPDMLSKVRQP